MIVDGTYSPEEESTMYSNELNALCSSIIENIHTFIKTNKLSLYDKIGKMISIKEIVNTIISSDNPFSVEKIDDLITSLRDEINALRNREDSCKKEIFSLRKVIKQRGLEKWISKDSQSDNDDTIISKIKRKLKTKENDYHLKELNYLLFINDQSQIIKELQTKSIQYTSNELKQIKLFPYMNSITTEPRTTRESNFQISRNTKCLSVGNRSKIMTHKEKTGLTDGNEESKIQKALFPERINPKNIDIVFHNNKDLKEVKSTEDLINYKLYQRNRFSKNSKRCQLNNNLRAISNLIDNHNKHRDFRIIKTLFTKPPKTYYGSFKKL